MAFRLVRYIEFYAEKGLLNVRPPRTVGSSIQLLIGRLPAMTCYIRAIGIIHMALLFQDSMISVDLAMAVHKDGTVYERTVVAYPAQRVSMRPDTTNIG